MTNLTINNNTITLVAGLHGNETGPVRALTALGYDFILGNPRAHERNVRFLEQDLNASFGTATNTYESRRATELLQIIPPDTVVIDFHTTSAVGEVFAILTDLAMLEYARYTGLAKAVLMSHNIKGGHALINHRNGVSIEISGYDTQSSFDETCQVVKSFEQGARREIELFEVYDRITEPGEYHNFKLHNEGFYPVLAGEQAYDFFGLKARKVVLPNG